ncbi:bifunctional phosphopantothenoylcysteine decarboxylase/phosphopantothenate--cysteine ligase CoaBC [soil metagenome]
MRIVLGVSGSVAAYRAADLARELMRAGATVRVCLTDSAAKFVTPALFEALTGERCLVGAFEEPEPGRMAHIDWARWADVLVIAPATASTVARLAQGIGNDMLTTIALVTEAPWVVAPAMNPHMFAAEADALEVLRARAAVVVEPTEGEVACGEEGKGKLAPVSAIVEATLAVARRSKLLEGKRVLITSGPTREPIDSVRFISNRSSGKMGAALARAARLMGAMVTVVEGPQRAALPLGVGSVRVETALQMRDAALAAAPGTDIIIGVAAVADYRPASPVAGKLRRSEGTMTLELVPNPDIVAELAAAFPKARAVGFAAEPDADLGVARAKLVRKGLFAIAANDVSQSGIGFDADENEIALVFADGREERSGRRGKLACALWLLESIVG